MVVRCGQVEEIIFSPSINKIGITYESKILVTEILKGLIIFRELRKVETVLESEHAKTTDLMNADNSTINTKSLFIFQELDFLTVNDSCKKRNIKNSLYSVNSKIEISKLTKVLEIS